MTTPTLFERMRLLVTTGTHNWPEEHPDEYRLLVLALRIIALKPFAEFLATYGEEPDSVWAAGLLGVVNAAGLPDVPPAPVYSDPQPVPFDQVRAVLTELGVLSPTDADDYVPGLLRALLS